MFFELKVFVQSNSRTYVAKRNLESTVFFTSYYFDLQLSNYFQGGDSLDTKASCLQFPSMKFRLW